MYSSPNVLTCGGYPGSLGFEKLHARQINDWGAKFFKYDYCPTRNKEQDNSSEIILERIRAMYYALNEINSDIIYAICEKGWVGGQVR